MNFGFPYSVFGVSPSHWTDIFFWISVTMYFVTLAAHILFALGVGRDAQRIKDEGNETQFVTPVIWMLATLAGGVFTAALYWLIHHSSLKRDANRY